MFVEIKVNDGDEIGYPESTIHVSHSSNLMNSLAEFVEGGFRFQFIIAHGGMDSVGVKGVDYGEGDSGG
jgi:hypothetical protein